MSVQILKCMLLDAFGLALCCAVWAQGSTTAYPQSCPFRSSDVPALSPDSVGSWRVVEQLGTLRASCAAARDTAVRFEIDAPKTYPGLVFQFDSLRVITLQYGKPTLDLDRPADAWMIFGTGATIQHKVPLSAPWSSLWAALGYPQVNARGTITVRFCSFPNAIITLNADPRAVATQRGHVVLETIPPNATIHHLLIMNPSLASHFLGC